MKEKETRFFPAALTIACFLYIFICDPSVRTAGLAVVLRPLLREFSFVKRHMFGDLFLREGKRLSSRSGMTRGRLLLLSAPAAGFPISLDLFRKQNSLFVPNLLLVEQFLFRLSFQTSIRFGIVMRPCIFVPSSGDGWMHPHAKRNGKLLLLKTGPHLEIPLN